MSQKRTLDAFFTPSASKKPQLSTERHHAALSATPALSPFEAAPTTLPSADPPSMHPTYPHPVPQLPPHLAVGINDAAASDGQEINDQQDLDLLLFKPWLPRPVARDLFAFLRQELFFYRVKYNIKHGGTETTVTTPRYTTVFGVDATSHFTTFPSSSLLDAQTDRPVPTARYATCTPRPIPPCLDALRRLAEASAGQTFNFCLVNYYATGADSIAWHSDDEQFLGKDPAIVSVTLGAKRDFAMKRKREGGKEKGDEGSGAGGGAGKKTADKEGQALKWALGSGDMVIMRGRTQAKWLHSVPKRKGGEADGGRINITFRKALVKGGTENYYRYNVGDGGVWRWDAHAKEMKPWVGR